MSCSPLHKGGQNPFCFILHSCPSEVILLVSKAGGNRSRLCTWGDIKTLMEKGNNPTRAAAVGCVRGADSIRSRGVLTRMSCVCSPAGPQAGALLRSHECFLRNPKQPHDTVPCCLLRKGFEKGSWAAGICAWLCCSSHSQGISTVVFFLLFFCCFFVGFCTCSKAQWTD